MSEALLYTYTYTYTYYYYYYYFIWSIEVTPLVKTILI